MLQILEKRHITIPNRTFAIRALENFSYYGLINGYKNTFLQIAGTDDFIPGTTFDELYTLHIIDTSLNNILLKYILFLEKTLKSRISYRIAEKYGVFTDWSDATCNNPNDYLFRGFYSNSNGNRINTLKSLKNCIITPKKNPSLIHYKKHHNHIPPWILTTNISYGLALQWYTILKSTDKNSICDSFISPGLLTPEENKEFIKKAFELAKEYRNKIAHGNRTFSIISLPQLPKKQLFALSYNFVSEEEYNKKMGQNDTLAIILTLVIMLNDQFLISNLITDLLTLFQPYINAGTKIDGKGILEILGFPENLFDRLKSLMQRKFT